MTTRIKGQARDIIIYVGAFEFPAGNAAAQRALANALMLRGLGYRVVLMGLSRQMSPGQPPRRADHADVPFDCWETAFPGGMLDWFRRITTIGEVRQVVGHYPSDQIAAVIAYDYPAVAQARLIRFCHSIGARAVAEVTEWYSVSRLVSPAALLRNIDRPLRMRVVNPRMDGLIVASRYLADFYRPKGRPVVVMPTLMSDPSPPAGQASPDGAPKRLFFAGSGWDPAVVRETREGPKDRLDKVIEVLDAALTLGADFRLDAYGVDRGAYLEIMPGHGPLLERLGDRVLFHGRQPREVVRATLRDADFSIFLRKDSIVSRAGFPTKLAESVHFGTPVITNDVGDAALYQQPGQTGFFIPYGDPLSGAHQLMPILSMSHAQIAAAKAACLSSRLFFYESHAERMGAFMGAVVEQAG